MKVIIYTRQNCPLCSEGIAIAELIFGLGRIELVDIDLDLALIDRYTDRVPVIETADGLIVDEGIISATTLADFVAQQQ